MRSTGAAPCGGGTGISVMTTCAEASHSSQRKARPSALATLHARLAPLAVKTSPLAIPPPRETRFDSRLALSRVHWVQPVLVAEITYLTWADDGLLRHTVFVGLRDDKPSREVRRERPD